MTRGSFLRAFAAAALAANMPRLTFARRRTGEWLHVPDEWLIQRPLADLPHSRAALAAMARAQQIEDAKAHHAMLVRIATRRANAAWREALGQ